MEALPQDRLARHAGALEALRVPYTRSERQVGSPGKTNRQKMADILKGLAAKLPPTWQLELKRLHFRRMIRRGEFNADEPEVELLSGIVSRGDWVIDVGANVGQYTLRLSSLVGPEGRVIALEPMPETMALLSSNVLQAPGRNITLLNVAASATTGIVNMEMPSFESGLPNYYEAHIVAGSPRTSGGILTIPIDSLQLTDRVSFVKIDAEGHEASVLEGMKGLLTRDAPALLIETDSPATAEFLAPWGYAGSRIAASPNILFVAGAAK